MLAAARSDADDEPAPAAPSSDDQSLTPRPRPRPQPRAIPVRSHRTPSREAQTPPTPVLSESASEGPDQGISGFPIADSRFPGSRSRDIDRQSRSPEVPKSPSTHTEPAPVAKPSSPPPAAPRPSRKPAASAPRPARAPAPFTAVVERILAALTQGSHAPLTPGNLAVLHALAWVLRGLALLMVGVATKKIMIQIDLDRTIVEVALTAIENLTIPLIVWAAAEIAAAVRAVATRAYGPPSAAGQ
jgi:hypothetical protein